MVFETIKKAIITDIIDIIIKFKLYDFNALPALSRISSGVSILKPLSIEDRNILSAAISSL
jgi:hypothetical protein